MLCNFWSTGRPVRSVHRAPREPRAAVSRSHLAAITTSRARWVLPYGLWFGLGLGLFLGGARLAGQAAEPIDFSAVQGRIRALHGGNNGPLGQGETVDVSKYHRELALPFTRLHDSAWPYSDIVDVHAIFPNFDADPEDPRAYRFGPTDDYLRAITNVGSRLVYRLGESIEHARRKRYVHPPARADQWARICVGVIRHYNEGWADGHRFGIDYWEIWNEPENQPAMWTGTAQQYYELYSVAAKTLKDRWPQIKVGGPSLGHQGSWKDGVFEPSLFLRGFIAHLRKTGAPLDFFSWHGYTDDPGRYVRQASAVRAYLDGEGFSRSESHLNEWNFLPGNDWGPMLSKSGEDRERWYARQGGMEGAAFIATTLIRLQDTPVDVANLYGADHQPFGLFTLHGAPKTTFYAVRAFRTLLDTPVRVRLDPALGGGAWVLAGRSDEPGRAGLLLARPGQGGAASHHSLRVVGLPWKGATRLEVQRLNSSMPPGTEVIRWPDSEGTLELDLPQPSVALIRLLRDSQPSSPP